MAIKLVKATQPETLESLMLGLSVGKMKGSKDHNLLDRLGLFMELINTTGSG